MRLPHSSPELRLEGLATTIWGLQARLSQAKQRLLTVTVVSLRFPCTLLLPCCWAVYDARNANPAHEAVTSVTTTTQADGQRPEVISSASQGMHFLHAVLACRHTALANKQAQNFTYSSVLTATRAATGTISINTNVSVSGHSLVNDVDTSAPTHTVIVTICCVRGLARLHCNALILIHL